MESPKKENTASENELKQKSDSKANSTIEILPDDLLVKVLSCLGCSKAAVQCKVVCSRWNHLIGDPIFPTLFATRCNEKKQRLPVVFLHRFFWYRYNFGNALFVHPSSLGPLFHPPSDIGDAYIAGAYKDLVLINSEIGRVNYSICNAQTKQRIRIPPRPSVPGTRGILEGFVCRESLDISPDGEFKYRIVALCYPSTIAVVFFSELGKWRQLRVSPTGNMDFDMRKTLSTEVGFPCNGMLYWMAKDFIFRLDPFSVDNNVVGCSAIPLPDVNMLEPFCTWKFGAFREKLRIISYSINMGASILKLFELEETNTSTGNHWRTKYEVELKSCLVNDFFITEHLNAALQDISLLRSHPKREEAVNFLLGDCCYVLCDMRRMRLDLDAPSPIGDFFQPSVLLELQWWPTRIPLLR